MLICLVPFCQFFGDSVVTGRGLIHGRPVFVFSQVRAALRHTLSH